MNKSGKEQQLAFLNDFIGKTDPDNGDIPEEGVKLRALATKQINRLNTPVRFIVTGEFSSGKSTLTNLLVGEGLIPTSVLASELPPLLFRFGNKAQIAAGWWDKTILKAFGSVDFDAAMALDPDYIVVTSPNRFLQDINVFDTPGTGDPLSDDKKMQHLTRSAEALIWCTNAVQAWRESERHMWSSLPAINRKHSILAITHTDLPAVKRNLDRVLTRVEKEAGDCFQAIIPVAAPTAMEAAPGGKVRDAIAWKESGGEALVAAINAIAEPIREKKLTDVAAIIDQHLSPFAEQLDREREQAKREVEKERAGKSNAGSSDSTEMDQDEDADALQFDLGALASEFPEVGETDDTTPDPETGNSLLETWNARIANMVAELDQAGGPEAGDLIQSSCDIVTEMAETLMDADPQSEEIEWLTGQFHEALDMLILVQLESGDEPLETSAILLLQLTRDLEQIDLNS